MKHTFMPPARRMLAAAVIAPLAFTASGCSDSGSTDSAKPKSAASSAPSNGQMADSVQVSDTWAKAADSGMSAAFGTLKNTGSRPVVITRVSGKNGPMELHVTQKAADGTMEMKETKAFTIAVGGSLSLKPGGSHMMFMKLTNPLKAGNTGSLNVTFQDGSTKQITVPIRAYDGAKEKYQSGASHGSSDTSDMPGMSGHSSTTGN